MASTSSVWPLPCTPAMATISPARTSRSRPLTAISRRLSRTYRSLIRSTTSPGFAGPFGTMSSTSRPTIRFASSWRVVVFGSAVPATRPRRRTTILSATSITSLSLWVMKITVVPAAVERADDAEQLLGLARGQHGARLVEDEDVALAVEGLEDLDALPDADRHALDLRVGVHVELVLLGQLDDPLARRGPVERAERPGDGLGAEGHGLDHVEHGHEHEVLVDHADAGGDRVVSDRSRTRVSPSMRISPESGLYSPDRMFMRVVLPAPFSPSMPRTSPLSAAIEILSLARTPGNCLVISRSSSRIRFASTWSEGCRPPPVRGADRGRSIGLYRPRSASSRARGRCRP